VSEFAVLLRLEEWAGKFGPPVKSAFGERRARQAVLSVGNFDGMHLGHQKILRSVVERARQTRSLAAVVTFEPHPLKVLRPGHAPPLVETLPQKLANFESVGLDAALVLRFDQALAQLSPEEFAGGILWDQLHANTILVGQNFRFGHRQAGDVSLLQEIGGRLGFAVEIVPPVNIDGQVVSSSAVRRTVAEGDVTRAARLLGRPFALTGIIERGTGRGSTIVVPTLNLKPDQELLPKTGVYATESRVRGQLYRGVTNVGFRPTFEGTHLSIESHLGHFNDKLTEGSLEVRFWERLRDEQKFADAEQLLRQIAADIEHAREFFTRLDALPTSPTQA
jgi:riboflavin kinase/FMN adenylyltransferase